eukprot:COSAG01_NODE_2792_length_7061_cov_20.067222_4_plen_134_part_00
MTVLLPHALPPRRRVGERLTQLGELPTIYAVGSVLLPTPRDWPASATTCGFFFLEEALTAPPEAPCGQSDGGGGGGESTEHARLKAWIAAHPRPVVVNFGSMACADHADIPRHAVRCASPPPLPSASDRGLMI